MEKITVFSEIGKLKKILLHRPGKELDNLTPEYLEKLLFDDIPYLKIAQEEHDIFADTLRNNGIEVLYIEELISETLNCKEEIKDEFINQFIEEADVYDEEIKKELFRYLKSFSSTQDMIDTMIAGIRKSVIDPKSHKKLSNMVDSPYPFYTSPMPNVIFTRDPFACIGNGVSLNHMFTDVRNRETIFGKYIFKYHPLYKDIDLYYNNNYPASIEGGDELILSSKVIAFGMSQRTQPEAIEKIATNLFNKYDTSFDTILAIQLPIKRSAMHLDTVFTQLDYDKFSLHSELLGNQSVYKICKNEDKIVIKEYSETIQDVLSEVLDINAKMIICGAGDAIDAAREQWSDGANTLAIAPNEIVVYDRNYVTNDMLIKNNVKLHIIPSSELSRGRGGPRCLSMPFVRESIE